RSSAGWFDRTIASAVVTSSVRYDNLTRKYAVNRSLDGRIEKADSKDTEDAAWAWLTDQFERMPLFRGAPLEVNAEYYVRLRAHPTPRIMSLVGRGKADGVVGLEKFPFMR